MNFTFRPLLSEWRVLGIVKLLFSMWQKPHKIVQRTYDTVEKVQKKLQFCFHNNARSVRTLLIFFPAVCLCERYESTAVHQFSLRNIISVVVGTADCFFNDYYCGTYSACLHCTHSIWAIKLCLLRRTNDFPHTLTHTLKHVQTASKLT